MVAEIAQIVASIDNTAIGIRDRAIILVGYASAMRPGEVAALDACDIITKPTRILTSIRPPKSDQDARGQLVGVVRGQNQMTDPILALDGWLKIRPSEPRALFTRIFHHGLITADRMRPRAVGRLVQGVPVRLASMAYLSPVTRSVPDMPPAQLSMAPRLTGLLFRLATAISARSSTTTSGRQKRS